MDEQLIALYHRHVAMAFDRQLRFNEFLARKAPKEKPKYDAATSILSFGKLKFEAHLLGTHQQHNNSWLWAWSDRNLNLTLTLTNRALGTAIRAISHRLGVHALAAPGFPLEPLLGTQLTERAAEVLGAFLAPELGYDAYYLTDRGRTTILIRDDRLKVVEKHPLRRVLTVFPQAIAKMPVLDHKAAFASYARDYNLAVTEGLHAVTVTAGNDSLTAAFDEHNRLTKLEGTVKPEPKKPAKPPVTKKPTKPVAKKPAKKAKPLTKLSTKKGTQAPAKSAKKLGKKR